MRWMTALFALTTVTTIPAEPPPQPAAAAVPHLESPFRAVDLNVGQSATVTLPNGQAATVKLVALAEQSTTCGRPSASRG